VLVEQVLIVNPGAKGAAEQLTRLLVPSLPASSVLAVGLGTPRDEWSAEMIRRAAGVAARSLNGVAAVITTLSELHLEAAVEGLILGAYQMHEFRSAKTAPKEPMLTKITALSTARNAKSLAARAVAIASAVATARDLVNTPPSHLHPAEFAKRAKALGTAAGLEVQVLDEKALARGGFGGIIGVGQGSSNPPRLVRLTYRGGRGKTAKKVALIGKGITFDTGGLTLKPGLGMLGMKFDMAGAATVGQAAIAIAQLGLKVRVTAYLCVAENMPSATATRPSDVIKFRNGKTVEVTNTDAEGRLVLADGLILASESKPTLIVDVATLTGGARIALGVRTAGLMGTDAGVEALKNAAEASGESLWAMPLPQELRKLLQSDTADLVNSQLGNPTGSMLVGGHFLREFVGTRTKGSEDLIDWAHLDIAGPANNEDAAFGYTPKGGTGVMLRTLVEVAKAL
jgi:leucyl aminopeptidase